MELLLGALTLDALIFILVGTVSGVIVGAIPGFTGGMLIALSIPLTFAMSPANALALLVAMYMGSITGGLVSAILLRMPGTPANVISTFDGYPMAQAGQVGRALGLAASASLIGGLFSWAVLVLMAEPLSRLAVRFTPWDYFSITLVALALITTVSGGSQLRGLLAAFAGVLLSVPGDDPSTGMPRLTFGWAPLENGFPLLPVFLGLFALSQVLLDLAGKEPAGEGTGGAIRGAWLGPRDYRRHGGGALRASGIGTVIGLLPGVGANIASIVAYALAKRVSMQPDRFGKGSEEGIVASEAANNASVGGALIPLVSLGIPGSVIDAILIGALILHGVTPGPMLFQNNPDVVYAILASCLVSAGLVYVVVLVLARPMTFIVRIPRAILLPAVTGFCLLGAYASSNRFSDVWVMLGFGVLGFLMQRGGVPLAPFAIGFVLAPIAEANLRTGLMISQGSFAPLWTNWLPLAMCLCALAVLVSPFKGALRPPRRLVRR